MGRLTCERVVVGEGGEALIQFNGRLFSPLYARYLLVYRRSHYIHSMSGHRGVRGGTPWRNAFMTPPLTISKIYQVKPLPWEQ